MVLYNTVIYMVIGIINGSTLQPRLETLHLLANYFKISPNDLIDSEYNQEFKIDKLLTKNNLRATLAELMSKTGIINISLLNKHSGVPLSVLSDILSGKTEKPNIKTLQKLANFFNLTIPQLVGTDPILDLQLVRVNLVTKTLPLLNIEFVGDWFQNHGQQKLEYINVNYPVINEKAFAININSSVFEPDFSSKQILILDVQKPEHGDFVVATVHYKTSIYECAHEYDTVCLREAGNDKWIKTDNLKFTLYGVVIQQIINFR